MHLRTGLMLLGTLFSVGLVTGAQAAPDYPKRPITLVVPYAPGGPTDTAARILAQGLQESTGANVIVENVPGGGATVGSGQVSRAKPDGYTLLWGGKSTHALAPNLRPDLSYHPFNSFEPVAMVGSQPYVLTVRTDSPYKSAADLVKDAKARPGALNYSSPGIGSAPHLASELFVLRTGIDARHIPYKGGAPAMMAVLSGEVDYYIDTPTLPKTQAEGGKVRLLGVSSKDRLPDMPDVPTFKELGYDGLEMQTWFGIFAPKDTPQDIVNWLNEKINAVLRDPKAAQALANAGFDVEIMTPQQFGQYVHDESERWGKIIRGANISIQ